MFLFLAVWILSLGLIFLLLQALPIPSPRKYPLAIVIAIATVARLVPLFVFRHQTGLYITDINDYHIVAEAVLHRQDAYVPTGPIFIHPYLPLHMYFLALADWAAAPLHTTFFVLVRIPQVVADIAIAALIFRASSDVVRDGKAAFHNGLSYAVCPFPILVAVYHGQFDAISALFALLSWYFVCRTPQTLRSISIAGAFLGLGILEKSWPAFLLPVVLLQVEGVRPRLTYAATAVGLVVAACAIYLISFSASLSLLIERTISYKGPPYIDGHTLVLHQLSRVFPRLTAATQWDDNHGLFIVLLAASIATAVGLTRRQPLAATISVIVALLVATTNGGSYHYLWVVPFALIARQRLFATLLILAASARDLIVGFSGGIYFMTLAHPQLQGINDHAWIVGVIEWTVLLCWFLWNLAAAMPRRISDLPAGYRRVLPQED